MNVPSSVVTISPILVLTYVSIMSVKRSNGIIQSLKQQCGHGDYSRLLASALIVIIESRGAAGSQR